MIQRLMFVGCILIFPLGLFAQPAAPPAEATITPVPVEDGKVVLSPENTLIQFVGKHAGAEPNPRVGHFQKFEGELGLDASGKKVKSLSVEIETGSLWTPIPDLTNHLNSADFFDSREHPTAKFVSSSIAADGKTVTGDFTLLGQTNELTFPIEMTQNDQGVTVTAEFTLDRSKFGMTQFTDRVLKEVDMQVTVGRDTASAEQVSSDGPPRFNPEEMFKRLDADGNGSLAGDEIPERMRENLEAVDTDKNGEVSLEELKTRMRNRGPGGRGGGRGTGRGPRSGGRPQRPDGAE